MTNIHHRGEFLQTEEAVEPGVPAILNPMPPGAKRDRMGLALWIVDPENPLTAGDGESNLEQILRPGNRQHG